MAVDRATARHMARHEGRRFYFCSAGCQAKFEAAPAQHLEARPAPQPPKAAGPAGTKYTCPMHPESVQEIGRAWCRERGGQSVEICVVVVPFKKKKEKYE